MTYSSTCSWRLAALVVIGLAGLLLTVGMMQAGAGKDILPGPTPVVPDPDSDMVLPASADAVASLQLDRRIVSEATINDLYTDTWPARQADVFRNVPVGFRLTLRSDAWDVSYGVSAGTIISSRPTLEVTGTTGIIDWFTVTQRTRSRVVRHANVVTMTASASSNQGLIDPLTSTIVYSRYLPSGAPANYWGDATPPMTVARIVPDTPPQDNFVQWVTTTEAFTGTVILTDTLYGSDITITNFTLYPPAPAFGEQAVFTIVVANMGTATAWRGFANEVYLRPASDPPPSNAYDHNWGIVKYQGDALFHTPGQPGNWPVINLAPGQRVTLTTVITLTGADAVGLLRAYAQADTAYLGDPLRYEWFGTNLEGMGEPPYSEERNVLALAQTIFITDTYLFNARPLSVTIKGPPGHWASYPIRIDNVGNVIDTYTATLTGNKWTVSPVITTVGPTRAFSSTNLLVNVLVPPTAKESIDSDVVTITIHSRGDPTQYAVVRLTTLAGYYRIYLPVVRR
jgi:hypothetical protein